MLIVKDKRNKESMSDGLYQVSYKGICAGFDIKDGRVVECAPILRKKIDFWKTIAVKVSGTREY